MSTPNGKAHGILERTATAERFIRWNGPGWSTVYETLTPMVVQDHIDGRIVIGTYPAADGVAREGVIDVDLHLDREPTAEEVAAIEAYAIGKWRQLRDLGVECLMVRGHRSGSFHIILQTVPIGAARLGRWLQQAVNDAGTIHVDTFPSVSGEGNAVRLPGRHHKRTSEWSEAWNGSTWEPWPSALDRLLALPDNPAKRFPDPGEPPPESSSDRAAGGTRPGDILNLLVPVLDVLEARGWKIDSQSEDRIYITRPGKAGGVSASVKGNTVWVFTSSVEGLPASAKGGKPYTAFALIAYLDFGGDFKLAARELAKAGFCAVPTEPEAFFTTAPTPPAPEWPSPPDPAAFHGLPGRAVEVISPASEADPVALLVQFLLYFGNVIGRTAHFEVEATSHYGNEFAVLMGQTAKGRKGTSREQIHRLYRAAEAEWAENRNQSGLSSGEGVIWAVRDPIEKQEKVSERGQTPRFETVVADSGIEDKRLLVYEPEFANVLKQTERQGNTLSTILRQAWESGSLRTMTKNSPARATGAHISIIGHITSEELTRYMSVTESANGFGNRFMWYLVKRSKLLPDGGRPDVAALAEVQHHLAAAIGFARGVGVVSRDAEARDLWHEIYADLSEGRPGLAGCLTGRAEAHVMRLAMLYALLDCSALIRAEHLLAATALWDYSERSVLYVFGDNLGDPLADDLLKLIRNAGDRGISRTDISTYLGRNVRAQEINRALGILQTHGLARPVEEKTGGRSAEKWVATSKR